MLDDLSSLPTLFNSINNCGWWCGILSGSTGPTGRPLSLITFAFQQDQWPDAYYFKMINLIIHLANSVLVYYIFTLILKKLELKVEYHWVALVAALLWAVSPIQISSVLYVVQRMTLLSSFFVLCGLVIFLKFRDCLSHSRSELKAWVIFLVGLAGAGMLAIFSKESGVLLLVYILILEMALFNSFDRRDDSAVKVFRVFCLLTPLVALILYMSSKVLFDPVSAYSARDFSLSERLLTQGRVLFDYISNIILPRASTLGLYHDDYRISRGLLDPPSSLFSLLGLLILIGFGWMLRHKMPLLIISILWFLGGHILESTILPLEIYFEHRNYLPAMLIPLLLVALFVAVIKKVKSKLVYYLIWSMGLSYLLLLLSITVSQASLWGDEFKYSMVQAAEHPESIRARSLEINALSRLGMLGASYSRMKETQQDFKRVSGMIVADVDYHCLDQRFQLIPMQILSKRLKAAKFDYGAIKTVSDYLSAYDKGECQNVDPEYILGIVRALQENPSYVRKSSMIAGYEARLLGLLGRYEQAADVFGTMNNSEDDWPIYIRYLALSGQKQRGVEVADAALEELRVIPQHKVYRLEVQRLREILMHELETEKMPTDKTGEQK